MKYFLQIIFLIFFLSTSYLSAQNLNEEERKAQYLADSTKIYIPKSIRPQFKFDTRTTTYEGQKVNIYGYDAGVMMKDKLRLTLGYYSISDDLPKEQTITEIKVKQNLRLQAGSINLELMYFRKRFFSLGFPLEIGAGPYSLRSFAVDSTMREIDRMEGVVLFSNFGLSGTFTPIRWVGLKGMVGYRKAVLASNKQFDFNGVFSSIALSIDVQEIVKDFRMYKLKKRYYGKSYRKLEGFADIIAD